MIAEQKRYEITIFNRSYSVLSDESEELIIAVEKKINMVFNSISQTTLPADEKQILILALLQITNELIKNDLQKNVSCDIMKELSDKISREV